MGGAVAEDQQDPAADGIGQGPAEPGQGVDVGGELQHGSTIHKVLNPGNGEFRERDRHAEPVAAERQCCSLLDLRADSDAAGARPRVGAAPSRGPGPGAADRALRLFTGHPPA
ncbi:hypothetical protein GCM10026982_27520 [Nocardiopsis aegyptia]